MAREAILLDTRHSQLATLEGAVRGGGSGERGSNAWVTYPGDGDSLPNGRVIPGDSAKGHPFAGKRVSPREGLT